MSRMFICQHQGPTIKCLFIEHAVVALWSYKRSWHSVRQDDINVSPNMIQTLGDFPAHGRVIPLVLQQLPNQWFHNIQRIFIQKSMTKYFFCMISKVMKVFICCEISQHISWQIKGSSQQWQMEWCLSLEAAESR